MDRCYAHSDLDPNCLQRITAGRQQKSLLARKEHNYKLSIISVFNLANSSASFEMPLFPGLHCLQKYPSKHNKLFACWVVLHAFLQKKINSRQSLASMGERHAWIQRGRSNRGSRSPPPLKNKENIEFLSNTGLDPL